MTRITEIYQGYLNLIEYLEEKFPGGVQIIFGKASVVMKISPVTLTTLKAFIQPACEKFSDLGSTHIDAYKSCLGDEATAVIYTSGKTALISILYHVAGMYTPYPYKSIRVVNPPSTGSFNFPSITNSNKDLTTLKSWLRVLLLDEINSTNSRLLVKALKHYEISHKGNRKEAIWFRERLTGHDGPDT